MNELFPMRRALTAILLASALAACTQSDQGPAAPALTPGRSNDQTSDGDRYGRVDDERRDPRTASQKPAATASSGSFALARCINRTPAANSAVFGPAGGILVFGDNRLIIPGGALRDTVTITATVLDAQTSRVELQPHGLRFARPAGLQLDTTACILSNPDYPSIVYLSPDGTVLETIFAVYDPHWHTIASPIDHFSGYAMGF